MRDLLLFMTDFYGYNEDVISELRKQGWNVTWFEDKITLNNFEGVVSKVFSNYKKNKFNKYFFNCLQKTKNNKFDLIMIIFGAVFFRKEHIMALKEQFPDTRIVYYSWDSVKNFPNIRELFETSDISYTFDPQDAKNYNVNFLPLFYTDYFSNSSRIKYDVSTVMSFFEQKANLLYKMISLIPSDYNAFYYLRIRTKRYYLKLKLSKVNEIKKLYKYFSLDPIPREEVMDIFLSSKVVIDCPLPNQSGLTMRTFEVLSKGRKLITSNKSIVDYDFYTPDNIFVVDENTMFIPLDFVNSKFNESYYPDKKYSLQNFILVLTS